MAVCVNTRYGRAGIVISGTDKGKLCNFADSLNNRIGYMGCDCLDEAATRALMMEENKPGAWGPRSSWHSKAGV